MAAHFGEMLLERRRAMGLSIQQVANTIKIRPQIIEYFETEDLDAMPPRGYAQGMISSYARYLGLNPRLVVDAYFDALDSYERGSGAPSARYREPIADASPRSANATGRFMMVDSRISPSRFAQRPPQAGYVPAGRSPHESVSADQLRSSSPGAMRQGPPPRGRGDASRPGARVQGGGARTPYGQRDGARARYQLQGAADRADVSARSRSQRGGRPTGGGRVPAAGARGRGSRVPPRSGGRRGAGSPAPSIDPRMLLVALASGFILLVLVIVLMLRGCAPKSSADTAGSAPRAESVDSGSSDDSDGSSEGSDSADDGSTSASSTADGSDADAASDSDDAASDAADDSDDAADQQETKVTVAIKEKGAVAFLEVKLDGKSVLGAQQIGPFEQEFTVTQQIEITTDKPSEVTVMKNGKKVSYDMKVSGVAKVTITAPQKDDGTDSQSTDGQDATSDAATQQQ